MSVSTTGAFTTSPTYTGSFIPQLWSGKLNTKFYATTVFGDIANTAYEGEIKSLGDKITINNIPSITINSYTIGSPLSYEVPAPSTVELTIDKAKYFGVNVSDVLAYQSKPNLMSMFSDDASKQMAINIDTAIWLAEYNNGSSSNKGATAGVRSAGYNLGTDTTPVTLTTSNIIAHLTSLASVLDEQNVPDTDRFLIIDPATRYMIMNSELRQAYLTGDSQSILRNGKIGQLDRFTVYLSNLLPKAAAGYALDGTVQGGAAKRRVIIAGHKSALTFAAQIVKTESLQNPNDFGTLVRGLNVYGHKMIKPEAWAMSLVV